MKALLLFLLGAVVGAFAFHLYQTRAPNPSIPADRAASAWNLDADTIKRELAASGRVIREKAHSVGDRIADARIVSVIKAKYVLDRDLSAIDINIDSTDGQVALTGTVASADLIAKALRLALDTDGVRTVTAQLTLPPTT